MKKIEEKNIKVESVNWMKVLAFGSVVDNVDEKNQAPKSTRVFEVMP